MVRANVRRGGGWTAGAGLLLALLASCGFGSIEIPQPQPLPPSQPAIQNARAPRVAVASNDKATCVWIGDGGVHAERYLPGVGWVPPVAISQGTAEAQEPRIATDDEGNAIVVWEQGGTVMVNEFEVGSGWRDPMAVSAPGGTDARDPQVAMNGAGDALVVWREDGDLRARPVTVASGWLQEVVLDGSSPDPGTARVVLAASGDTLVVWETGASSIAARFFDAADGTWGPDVVLGNGSQPALAGDAQGGAVVAWTDAGEVRVAQHLGAGAFAPPAPIPLPPDAGPAHSPDVGLSPKGDCLVVFCVEQEVHAARILPAGPAPATPLADGVLASGGPLVVLDADGDALVVFPDHEETIRAVPYERVTETYGAPVVVGGGSRPSLSGNPDGLAVTVFQGPDGVGGLVFQDVSAFPAHPLALEVPGGGGRIQAVPAALGCALAQPLCVEAVAQGVWVRLEAVAEPGFRFSHWIGCDGDASQPTCAFVVDGPRTVEARFLPE